MSTFKNRRIYFQTVAHLNKLIADGQVVNGIPRKSFFRMNAALELSASVVDKADFPCVVQNGFTVLPAERTKFVYRKTIINELWFLSRFDAQNGIADEYENALDEAYQAATQFLAYMLDDVATNGCCGNLFHFDLNNSKIEELGPVLDNTIGWRLTFQDFERGPEFDFNSGGYYDGEPEIIYFTNEKDVDFDWSIERQNRFGEYPFIQVWYSDAGPNPVIAWPTINADAPAPDQTTFTVHNGTQRSGYIILK
jgi:hypothetical protein